MKTTPGDIKDPALETAHGFALIEAIFAASFIITVVVVLFSGMVDIIELNRYAKEQTIGRYLLQDTVEMIAGRQQYNLALSSAKWYLGIGDNVACVTSRCMMATTLVDNLYSAVLSPCYNGCRLSIDSVADLYVHYPTAYSVLTPFYRYVTVRYEDFDLDPLTYEAITYTVTVEWLQGDATSTMQDVFTLYHI